MLIVTCAYQRYSFQSKKQIVVVFFVKTGEFHIKKDRFGHRCSVDICNLLRANAFASGHSYCRRQLFGLCKLAERTCLQNSTMGNCSTCGIFHTDDIDGLLLCTDVFSSETQGMSHCQYVYHNCHSVVIRHHSALI